MDCIFAWKNFMDLVENMLKNIIGKPVEHYFYTSDELKELLENLKRMRQKKIPSHSHRLKR